MVFDLQILRFLTVILGSSSLFVPSANSVLISSTNFIGSMTYLGTLSADAVVVPIIPTKHLRFRYWRRVGCCSSHHVFIRRSHFHRLLIRQQFCGGSVDVAGKYVTPSNLPFTRTKLNLLLQQVRRMEAQSMLSSNPISRTAHS